MQREPDQTYGQLVSSGREPRGAMMKRYFVSLVAVLLANPCSAAEQRWPVVFADDFENGMANWETTDPDPANPFWRVTKVRGWEQKETQVLRVTGMSDYQPRFRSPQSIAWLKHCEAADFELTARVQSTNVTAGAHRDMCLFWGRQDADHYYYVHLGAQSDPNACQIFIVNGAARTPITKITAKGTPWGDGWHLVKVSRRSASGEIAVYFDDLTRPLMTAEDRTFARGRVGLGTFDDHGNWDDFELRAPSVSSSAGGARER